MSDGGKGGPENVSYSRSRVSDVTFRTVKLQHRPEVELHIPRWQQHHPLCYHFHQQKCCKFGPMCVAGKHVLGEPSTQCLWCGDPGHKLSTCPHRDQRLREADLMQILPIHHHRHIEGIRSRSNLQPIVSAQLAAVPAANAANGDVPQPAPTTNRIGIADHEAVSDFLDQVMSDW